ncbi:Rv1733c family protein [Streptomyces sp. NPDC001880]
MRAVTGVWRWRRNPLRRATDRREARVALVALLLMVLAAPALGWVCGVHTDDALQKSVRAQRAGRQATTAVVVRRSPGARFVTDPGTSSEHASQTSVVARWKAPDGTDRRGTVMTSPRRTGPGSEVEIWTDLDGRPVQRPMDAATARTHAVLAGLGATLLGVGLIEGVRQLTVRHMMRRRYTLIDQDWARTGPDWGRTGAGS